MNADNMLNFPDFRAYERSFQLMSQVSGRAGRMHKQGNVIITDLTLEKLRSQRRILIYTEHPVVHPETGRPVGSDHHVLGLARITQADEKLARARLQPDADPAIQPRQHVITQ
jgi:hypothetical protein